MTLTVDDLLRMSQAERLQIMMQAHPLNPDEVADHSYTGIDLSMPAWFHRLMWRSFRKTFHRDPVTGRLRGWNVKVEQVGWDTPPPPKRDRSGRALSFGHYELRSARGLSFPRGWQGGHYLEYRHAGNHALDFPANAGTCPLVAVNAGSSDLLLGWEIFTVAGLPIPLMDFWALKKEGPLRPEDLVPRPDGRTDLPALPA
jgi:hypothetical protein